MLKNSLNFNLKQKFIFQCLCVMGIDFAYFCDFSIKLNSNFKQSLNLNHKQRLYFNVI